MRGSHLAVRRVPPLVRLLCGGRLSPAQANRLPFFDERLDQGGAALAASELSRESWQGVVRDPRQVRSPTIANWLNSL
jgi:hypothetical protein